MKIRKAAAMMIEMPSKRPPHPFMRAPQMPESRAEAATAIHRKSDPVSLREASRDGLRGSGLEFRPNL
jgi:hypothetical protein